MKNWHWLSILMPLVAVALVLSLFSGAVAAQVPGEQYEKNYRMNKEKYESTEKKLQEAREAFDKAYAKLRDAKDPKSKDELIGKTRNYLERAINHTISYLEIMKSKAALSENNGIFPFDAAKNIDAHIAQLEQLRTKVQQATTMQELIAAHKELKDTLIKIKLEARYYSGLILDHRIDKFITRADTNVTKSLEAAIEKRKNQGKDVTELQKDEERYKELLQEAKTSQQQTDTLLASPSGFASDGTVTDNKAAAEFIRKVDNSERDTIKKLKALSKQILDFVRDFKKLSGGKANVGRTGELEANESADATPTATSTPAPTVTATATANATASETVTATPTETATSTPTPTATATETAAANTTG